MRLSRSKLVSARARLLGVCALMVAAPTPHRAQLMAQIVREPRTLPVAAYDDLEDTTRRSGPRFGVVYLGGTLTDTVAARARKSVRSLVSFFGWDFQYQIGRNSGGPQPLTDFLVGVGGLEQGVVLPSVSFVIGMRLPNAVEFGVGPNVSGAGPALVLTAGITRRMGTVAVPIDVAVVPSSIGTLVSVTTGFNVSR